MEQENMTMAVETPAPEPPNIERLIEDLTKEEERLKNKLTEIRAYKDQEEQLQKALAGVQRCMSFLRGDANGQPKPRSRKRGPMSAEHRAAISRARRKNFS